MACCHSIHVSKKLFKFHFFIKEFSIGFFFARHGATSQRKGALTNNALRLSVVARNKYDSNSFHIK
jgi:hypothetical protein